MHGSVFSVTVPFGQTLDKSSPSRSWVRDCSNEEDMSGGYKEVQFSRLSAVDNDGKHMMSIIIIIIQNPKLKM